MFPDLSHCGRIEDVGLGVHWDGGALAGEVARRAAILAQHGAGPGSVVAIFHSGSAFFFADLFAVWSVGAAAACLDGSLTETELRNVVGFVKPAVLLVDRPKVSVACEVPVLELADGAAPADTQLTGHVAPDAPALILFTSGTTGTPKGVVLTHLALQMRIALNAKAIGAAVLRRTLVTLPTHFGHGLIGNALTPLLNGGDIVLCAPGDLRGDQLGRIIDRDAITFMSSVPALWNLVLRTGARPAGNSLRRVHVGSAPLSAKLWSEIAAWTRAEVVNCLGMTETANWIAGASSRTDGIADGLVGKPWGGEAGVLDDHGEIEPTGTGEIVVRSPCLTSGYFKRPDLTAAVMIDGWFRTGDRGAVDEFGRIWLTGRIKDEINRAGFKVQPAEIDMVIERHPAVAESCVFGLPDPVSGEVVGAAVRLKGQGAADATILQAWCRERLRREAVPERWFIVGAIPRNARGKVNRDAVRRELSETTDTPADVDARPGRAPAPSTVNVQGPVRIITQIPRSAGQVKAVVERAWTSVVGRQSFRADTRWDQAGGDSIGAMRLWLHIEQQLGMSLPLERLEFNTTPSQLIGVIEKFVEVSDQGSAAAALHPQQPLVFLLPAAHGDTPAVAQFRAAFNGRLRFDVIRYPALDEFIDRGAKFDLLVDAAVAQINAHGQLDTYYLAGYSFGGFVAWETARRLLADGRQVSFLGLIDTRLVAPKRRRKTVYEKAREYVRLMVNPAPRRDDLQRRTILASFLAFGASFWDACLAAYGDLEWWFFELLARKFSWSMLRRIDRLAGTLPRSAGVMFQWQLIARLRNHARERATVKPLDVATTLFRSDEQSDSLPDHGWGNMCRDLVVLPIRGGHLSVFGPNNREELCTMFAQAVDAASTGQRQRR
jgi:acyl-CoA synthetase (AMP-forming)/AMP-acid ligase II/pimeloyl-ACP methyl ester carboxylesterase